MSESGVPAHGLGEEALRALVEASALMNKTLNPDDVFDQIARSAADVLQAEASSVLLLDRTGRKLVFRAVVGESAHTLLGESFDASLGIAGRVVSGGKAQLVPDVTRHPDFFGGIDEKSSFVTRGMAVAPLTHGGDVRGVVEVINKRSGSFSDADLQLLQVFANLAAASCVNAQQHQDIVHENQALRERLDSKTIVGASGSLRSALALCDRVASTNSTVLLLGETGTGKELTARRIHMHSSRASRPFVAINCAALPETLLESELFGHEAGAFTGATTRRLGRFEIADGGTLFLDEIGDISASTQIKLLRVLQEREFVRVGGSKTISCDVRIIAATNRDLKTAIERGNFREDLFYRLNVFPVHLPPLRERAEDVQTLAEFYVDVFAREFGRTAPKLSEGALHLMREYRWPGNVREMRNVMERAVLLADGPTIEPAHLPREISGAHQAAERPSEMENYERALILKALEDHDWNQTRTAQALGLSRDNLRYRLKKYQLERPSDS